MFFVFLVAGGPTGRDDGEDVVSRETHLDGRRENVRVKRQREAAASTVQMRETSPREEPGPSADPGPADGEIVPEQSSTAASH